MDFFFWGGGGGGGGGGGAKGMLAPLSNFWGACPPPPPPPPPTPHPPPPPPPWPPPLPTPMLDCADVFRSQDLRCSDINHVVIKRTICVCTFFFRNVSAHQDIAIHVHAPIKLRRCISAVSRQNLSWERLDFHKLYIL